MAAPLWQKDLAAADWVIRFTVGDDYLWDRLLLPYDARATRAHARGLVHADVLTAAELVSLDAALDAFLEDVAANRVTIRPEDEDAHTVLETYLVERLGDTGKKIHTGRSRNDQVLAALRLCLKDRLAALARDAATLGEALCAMAEAHPAVLLPGYTHLQRAMPSTVALWALGYAELLADDLGVLQAARTTLDASPLGSAAGYGVPGLDLPRENVAHDLGFARVQTHVTAVQLSRGKFELGAAHACLQVAATLNRLAADLVLFTSAEFAFVRLPERFTTGSSIMPQKRNPDVAELARAAYHRVAAEMNVLVTLPAGLPSGYHRDLQLTKEAVLRATAVTADVLAAMNALVPGLTWDRVRLRAALTPDLFATAHALDLVARGVPFRDAYRQAAVAVPTLAVPDPALAAYRVDGMPGHERPNLVRKTLAEAAAWATAPDHAS
jgi:argininosuccinate lyase